MNKYQYRSKVPEDLAVMLWNMGLDTHDIASRIGARESDVHRVLSALREHNYDPDCFAIPSQREQALEDN
jgi:DNA-binding transcriptional regulator LsrR (DeoR family)